MKDKPRVELKNLKHAEFASQETACYEATVYVDGKRFCMASNQGHGGPDSYDAIGPRGGYKSGEEAGAARREVDENIHNVGLRFNPNAVKTYPKGGFKSDADKWIEDDDERHAAWDRQMSESDQVTTYQVFENLVGDALTVALYSKDMKSAMSKKWLFTKKAGGQLFECKRRKGHDAATMLDVIRKGDPEAILLNTLPAAEALAIWRANG